MYDTLLSLAVQIEMIMKTVAWGGGTSPAKKILSKRESGERGVFNLTEMNEVCRHLAVNVHHLKAIGSSKRSIFTIFNFYSHFF